MEVQEDTSCQGVETDLCESLFRVTQFDINDLNAIITGDIERRVRQRQKGGHDASAGHRWRGAVGA